MTRLPSRNTARRVLIWAMLGFVGAISVATLVITMAPRPGSAPLIAHDPLGFLSGIAIALGYAIVFGVLVSRQPDHRVAWIFGAVAVVAGVASGTWTYVSFASDIFPPRLPATAAVAWLGGLTVPVWGILLTRLALVFPDGRLPSPRWAPLMRAQLALAAIAGLCIGFGAGPIALFGLDNPFALAGTAGQVLKFVGPLALLAGSLLFLPAAYSVVLRYRRADRVGRLQLKWFVFAALVFAVVGLAFLLIGDSAVTTAESTGSAAWLAFAASATFIPVAAMIAILRHRLYQIDTIIGRTFVYGTLVAILAGLYSAGIQLFTWAFKELTGQSSDGALVVTTLVLATTFTPIKGRLERVAERRLKEPPAQAVPAAAAAGVALDLADPSVRAFAATVAAMVRQELDAERPADAP